MLRGFRDFIARGNLMTPLIAAVFGKPDFSALTFTINDSRFGYGSFINALIAFLTVSAAIYFVIVAPLNAVERHRHGPDGAKTRDCPFCVSAVPVAATRCAFCTSELPAVASSS